MSWKLDDITFPRRMHLIQKTLPKKLQVSPLRVEAPLVLDLGPGVEEIKLTGILSESGKTSNQLETDYLLPLLAKIEAAMGFPFVIADDGQAAFWSVQNIGSGGIGEAVLSDVTTPVMRGKNALKIDVPAGAFQYTRLYHVYSPYVDWGAWDFIAFWLYGLNDSANIVIKVLAPTAGNRYTWTLVDNWSSFENKALVFADATKTGSPNLSTVGGIQLEFNSIGVRYSDKSAVGGAHYVQSPEGRYNGKYLMAFFEWVEEVPRRFGITLRLQSLESFF